MKTYRGMRTIDGLKVMVDGEPLDEHYDVKQFTSWFRMDLHGCGATTARLGYLADHLGDGDKAVELSEQFMKDVIANMDNDWMLTSDEINEAINAS